jgi:uncharacterized protein (DUF488 family)
MDRQLYTLGYHGWTLRKVVEMVAMHQAILMDIRYSPMSWQQQWTRKSLLAVLGEHYLHVPALGNRNYRGGEIEIVEYEAGRELVCEQLSTGRNVMLMCVCRDVATCHRLQVARRLEEDLRLPPTRHLEPPEEGEQLCLG